jgi:hypothetical protein
VLEELARENFVRASSVEKGVWAVGQAQNAQRMKTAGAAPSNEFYDASGEVKRITQVKQVTNKTFYLQNAVWVDNGYTPDQNLIKVKRFSEAYFQLGTSLPGMNQYLALGQDVIVTIGKQSFQIGEDGATRFTEKELRSFF